MANPDLNYYEVLGLNQSATANEIRRAYRILARRYHPDLNPGQSSEERFKRISLAYQTLLDPEKRRNHDAELDSAKKIKAGFAAYEKAQRSHNVRPHYQKNRTGPQSAGSKAKPSRHFSALASDSIKVVKQGLFKIISRLQVLMPARSKLKIASFKPASKPEAIVRNVSVVEMSVTMKDAIFGGRKSVEIPVGREIKKLSVRLSAGVRTGSVLRLTSGSVAQEEYILIVRVAPHPMLEATAKGLIINIPVSVSEALFGAQIKVPGLDCEETISLPPGSQSGDEIRMSQRGIKFDDGKRGDLFYRLMIQIPSSSQAVGISEKVQDFSRYYETQPRSSMPTDLMAHLG